MDLGADGRGRARDRRRPARARLRAGRVRVDPRQHGRRMGPRRPRRALRRRRFQRDLSDRRAGAGRVPPLRLALARRLRRGRRAARQGARGARAAAAADAHRRLRRRRAARLPRSDGDLARRPARARSRPREGASGRARRARRRVPAEGSGDPDLHLGDDRQAERGDALARGHRLHAARLQHDHRPGRGRRADVLPAALPRRRAARRRVLRDLHRLDPELRREPGDGARERSRDRAHGRDRRAADLGEVLFERRHRHPRVGARAAGGLRAGRSASAAGSPTAFSPASRSAPC